MVSKIADLIPDRFKRDPAPGVLTDLDKRLGQKIQQRKGRLIDTSHGGPKMPKYQPCDICGRGAKRVQKTSTGAKYHCKKCNNSMVIAAK